MVGDADDLVRDQLPDREDRVPLFLDEQPIDPCTLTGCWIRPSGSWSRTSAGTSPRVRTPARQLHGHGTPRGGCRRNIAARSSSAMGK